MAVLWLCFTHFTGGIQFLYSISCASNILQTLRIVAESVITPIGIRAVRDNDLGYLDGID